MRLTSRQYDCIGSVEIRFDGYGELNMNMSEPFCGWSQSGARRATLLLSLFGFAAIATGVFHISLPARAQEKSPLKLITTIPLPGFSGDFDHFAVDLKGNRLFLAAEDHKTVEVFDLKSGKSQHSITGFGQPHAILFVPDANRLIVTDGDDFGRVALIDGKSYQIVDSIKLPPGVDGAIFNPVEKNYYVESGGEPGSANHLLNIVDTKGFKLVGNISLPGNHSEAMAVDRAGKKLYVNLTRTNEVGTVDLGTRQLIARWPVPDAKVENSMVLDEPNHRLFIATREPPKFIVFNTDTGKAVTSLPCAPFNDDMWFDRPRKRIYATGSETATVIEQRDADHYEHVAEVPTGYRAKTSIFVPELNRLYVAVSGKFKPDAMLALEIFEVR
jgi:DNA-binding beta-propeller fold protein YncE